MRRRPPAAPAAWVTLSTLAGAYQTDPERPIGAGLDPVFTDGFPASYFLSAPDRIRMASVFTEGQPGAYMTTDVWVNFPVIWLQPLYVFVSAWNEQPPRNSWVTTMPWVATVGDKSAFWSPFWRVYYVLVPADTPPDRYRSTHDILSAGLPIFPGQARLLTLTPPEAIAARRSLVDLCCPSCACPRRWAGRVPSRSGWKASPISAWPSTSARTASSGTSDTRSSSSRCSSSSSRTRRASGLPLTNLPRVGGTGPLFERRPGDRARQPAALRVQLAAVVGPAATERATVRASPPGR